MKKFITKIFVFLFILATIVTLLFSIVFFMPPVYRDSYSAAIIDKYDRLKNIEEPKIILVGGSNFAFGIDSETIEEAFGMPVVNLGVSAGYGMNTIFNYVKETINEGDIIILGLEYGIEMSSYDELMCKSIENDLELISLISEDSYKYSVKNYLKYIIDKMIIVATGDVRVYEGVYRRDSFNKYGDISFPCESNIMESGYDENNSISIIANDNTYNMITAVNNFNHYVSDKGAEVYFTFPAVNEIALNKGSDLNKYMAVLEDQLNVTIISVIDDYIMDSEYFYNSNYHLNDMGKRIRTEKLINDMLTNIELLHN